MAAYVLLRGVIPQLHAGSVTLRNRLYAAPPAVLRGGRTLVWQDSGRFAVAGELHCSLGGAALGLAADQLSLLEPRLQGFEWFVPSPACTALVEHAMAPVLELLERLAGAAIACDEFRRIDPRHTDDAMTRIGFVLLGANQQAEVRGWVRASPRFWHSLDLSRTPALVMSRIHAVPVDLSIQVGRCRLPLAEIRQLELGDALRVTPRLTRNRDGLPVQVAHVNGGFGARARLAGDQLILETPMKSTTDPTLPPPVAAPARTPEEPLLSSIECDLTFELGQLRLSLAEVSRLRVGQAMHTGARLQDQPVRILIGGRQIARGELAALGDEIVVVLTETSGLPTV